MAGNVVEWVADWYDEDYYKTGPHRNPEGPSSGKDKVLRGGSWGDLRGDLRSPDRRWLGPTIWVDLIGFRCLQDIPK